MAFVAAPQAPAQTTHTQGDVPTSTVDTAVVLESKQPFVERSIANPDIADISTLSDTAIYVPGRTPGRTTLILVGADGKILDIVNIMVTQDISELQARLAGLLPGEEIEASELNGGLVLSENVSTRQRLQQALDLAERYAPGRVTNLLASSEILIAPPADQRRDKIRGVFPAERIEVTTEGNTIILSGAVSSAERIAQIIDLAQVFAPRAQVTNLLSVQAECTMKTRRGGEVVETRVPCGN